MLARLQQFITVSLLVAACAWLAYFWQSSPPLAVGGFVMLVLGYSGFLALEFVALRFVNRSDPAPQPPWHALMAAWVGETLTAPRVFCWRQPFRSHAFADQLDPATVVQGQRGVVFVHGFFCNRGFWAPWLKRLQGTGHAYVAVNLEPPFGSIDSYSPQIEDAVQRVGAATGVPPLVVCHSMGGLAVRAWLKTHKAEARVHHVVTIGTPHRGTWLARFSRVANGREMQLSSPWQQQLDVDMPAHRHTLFTCWYSNCDNIVFPTSTATLPDADNRFLSGVAHVQMAFVPEVMNATLAMVRYDSSKSIPKL
ncbi:MAG TPA: alpha/beta fold hydrolase [Polaromonas sp.]|uniref:esterase/lipase family protein n=1 Tax=Polaromonas sp. TaxID=1869339 RepID=UPI002D40A1A6|nr:alpha/beta fold hydrolase [Polaromonas sp.]HYW56281.1 alpha/beta fold hydrolase [Polaromonas sp.]